MWQAYNNIISVITTVVQTNIRFSKWHIFNNKVMALFEGKLECQLPWEKRQPRAASVMSYETQPNLPSGLEHS